jgi:hypothetical protein
MANTEKNEHQQAVFMENLKGSVVVNHFETVANLMQLRRAINNRAGTSKASKELVAEYDAELLKQYQQASDWAMSAFPEEFVGPGSGGKPHAWRYSNEEVFRKFNFTVMVSINPDYKE